MGAWACAAFKSGKPPLSLQVAVFFAPHASRMGTQEERPMVKRSVIIMSTLLFITAAAAAQNPLTMDPVVVTASRVATPLSQANSAITVISAEQIEASGQPLLTDVLRQVPGLDITRSGGAGGNVSVFIRGTDSKHTLILVDGIEFNDPVDPTGAANITHLSTDNIERIEIVRGPQSVIYGSDSIGGVINIITKKGKGKPAADLLVEGGSYRTWKERAAFDVGSQSGYLAFSAGHIESDGFSSAHTKYGNNEKDGYRNTTFSLNTGGRYTELFELNVKLRYTDSTFDYDAPKVDADNTGTYEALTAGIDSTFHLLAERWQLKLALNRTIIDREDQNESFGSSSFDGTKDKLELQNRIQISAQNTLVFGAEIEQEDAQSSFGQDDRATHRATYLENRLSINAFDANFGVRLDDHQEYGSHTTWRIAPAYRFSATDTRIRAAIGTGFKAPSLFQLYDSFSGNPNLQEEKSLGYDIGIEQTLFKGTVVVDMAWFYNDIEDVIEWIPTGSFTGQYRNGGNIRSQGIETAIDIYPVDILSLQLGYTYTDTKNKEDGARLLKRPLHKGHMDINLYPINKLEINGNLVFVGQRDDFGGIELGSYTLVNLAASYAATETLKLFGRIDNLFDKDYEEVAGFGTAGLSAYAGLKLTF
jgi:vitamin B12 transporter